MNAASTEILVLVLASANRDYAAAGFALQDAPRTAATAFGSASSVFNYQKCEDHESNQQHGDSSGNLDEGRECDRGQLDQAHHQPQDSTRHPSRNTDK